jgi:DNA polymerase-3 subunit gamma/tau
MAYQSLYRRFRPRRFSEIYGQDHVVTALRNAVRDGRVGHAYLFSGPRGTGKTSTARILAKVLNCTAPVDGEPDLVCPSCIAIETGSSFDIHEMDAASNNKVDDIRDIVERVAYLTPGRTKVYILDEVHMLTPSASAALLKTLEEPPDDVVFVLATTDPQKVMPTIRSRTQHFAFHLLPAKELEEYVRHVIDAAGLDVSQEALEHALAQGAGSARDALSALEMVVAAGGVTEPADHADEVIDALAGRDTGRALSAVAAAVADGRDPRLLAEHLLARLRDVFLAAMRADLSYLPDRVRERAVVDADRFERPYITRCLEVIGETLVDMRQAPDPRVGLDVALVRLTNVEADTSLAALVERVARLERQAGGGGHHEPAGEPAVASRSTSRPAAAARRALSDQPAGEMPAGERPALGGVRAAAARTDAEAAPVATTAPALAPAATAGPAETVGAAVGMPDRDDLTLAWGDTVLGGLPQPVRVRWGTGRFVGVTGEVARFALPNAIHRDRAEEQRPEVERALSEHFGRPVRVELVLDADQAGPSAMPGPVAVGAGQGPGPAHTDVIDEVEPIDPAELVDAPVDQRRGLDVLSQHFPDAQLFEEDDET